MYNKIKEINILMKDKTYMGKIIGMQFDLMLPVSLTNMLQDQYCVTMEF